MIAFLIAYGITGLIIWAGIVAEVIEGGHDWSIQDFVAGVPVTMIGLVVLWPAGIANWQIKEWKKAASQ
jgi:hypothetical protein